MGNETKHTPEPWKLDPKKDWDKVIRIENKGDGHHRLYVEVCRDDCDTDTAEANARLIAAAPLLLKTLEECANAMESTGGTQAQYFITQARAAIAKATGSK